MDPSGGPGRKAAPHRLLWQLLSGQAGTVLAGALAGVVWMGGLALVPWILSRGIDAGVAGGEPSALVPWLAALGALTAVHLAAGGARHWLACRLYYGTTVAVSDLVGRRLHDPRGGVRTAPGALVALVSSDANRIGAVADLCCRGAGALVAVVGVGVLLVAMSPPLAAWVLVALPVLLGLAAPLMRPLERRATHEQRSRAAVAAVVADTIAGLRVLQGLGALGPARARVVAENERARRAGIATGRIAAGWEALSVVVPGALLALIVAVGGALVTDGRLTLGELVGFLAYGQFLLVPLATLMEVGDVWTRGQASAARVVDLVATPWAVVDAGRSPAGSLDADDPPLALVSVAAGDATLTDFSVTVGWGEVVAVAADDGRAAQALADLLARRTDPARGSVLVAGRDARAWPLRELRRTLLVAHGDGHLLVGTVRSNVAFGCPTSDPARLAEAVDVALGVADADDIVVGLPHGADSPVGERGRLLSGGQRQRIGLARAVAADPAVLVLVGPTSAVDAHTELRIAERLLAARRGRRATLVITWSPALLAAADRVVHLAGGAVADVGSHRELLVRSRAYRTLTIPEPAAVAR